MRPTHRFQFSVSWLFILTTVAAVAAAIISSIQAPQFVRIVVSTYVILWSIYVTFKLNRVCRILSHTRHRLQEIRESRRAACSAGGAESRRNSATSEH